MKYPPRMPEIDRSRWQPLSGEQVQGVLDQEPYRGAQGALALVQLAAGWLRGRWVL